MATSKKLAKDDAAENTEAEAVETTETETQEAPAKVVDAPDGPTVAAGCAITTKRGVVGPGESICKEDFASEDAFDGFVKSGHIVK